MVTAWFSTRFLLRFFKTETRNLLPFGIYSVVAGAICILIFA